jgi:hypothetical protein
MSSKDYLGHFYCVAQAMDGLDRALTRLGRDLAPQGLNVCPDRVLRDKRVRFPDCVQKSL